MDYFKNMTKTIYGVDISKIVTPLMVRDALVECFFQAHCANSDVEEKDKDVNKLYCKEIVKNAFKKDGFEFDNPTKEGIILVMNGLAEFAKNFRDQELVQKNYNEIMQLVDKIV